MTNELFDFLKKNVKKMWQRFVRYFFPESHVMGLHRWQIKSHDACEMYMQRVHADPGYYRIRK